VFSLNVLLATDYFPPHVGGGVEQVTYHVAEELVRRGDRVAVVTLNTCSSSPVENLDGIHVYRAAPIGLTNVLGVQSSISTEAVRLIRRVCQREQSEVLHANNIYFSTTIASCLHLKSLGVPLVTTLHLGSISELKGVAHYAAKAYEKSIGRWILAKSNHVVAVSEAVKRYAESLGIDSAKVSVVPNTVDTEKFCPSRENKRDDLVRVGFMGRLISNKGAQYLIEAAPQILRKFSEVQFHIAGDGPMLRELTRRVNELGVDSAFRFLGVVPSNVEFIQSCDILVRPSLTDGMPLTVLEAMACGLPNVATRVGGTPEILHDAETGYLVDPGSIPQLVSRISRLVADADLRIEMGRRAREFVENYYSWEHVGNRLSAIYEQTVNN